MNFDESQLSAYLDDELDPDDHLMVAWNVESSLAVAQQLADLKSVRDLVAELGRPAIPLDLSAAVLANLPRCASKRRPLFVRVGLTAAMFGGVGALAASLMLALLLLFPTLHDDPTPSVVSLPPATEHRTHRTHPTAPIQSLTPPIAQPQTALRSKVSRNLPESPNALNLAPLMQRWSDSVPAVPSTPPVLVASETGKAVLEHQNRDEAKIAPAETRQTNPSGADPTTEAVDLMLGNRKVLRALIVTDVLDQTAREVRSIIEQDPGRKSEFGRITLTQGIVIDPDQPGEAEVFSVVMPDANTDVFLTRLAREFPDLRVETEATPAMVTHLSEIGQVELITDGPARLGLPPRGVRAMVATKRAANQEHLPLPELDATSFGTDPLADARQHQFRADFVPGPVRKFKSKMATGPASEPGQAASTDSADESVTVLVWVARRPRR